MRLFVISLVALGILPPLSAAADSRPDLGRLLPAQAAGWKPSGENRVFTRDDIFQYIDGAGEIYLGFAFKRVLVREYSDGGKASLVAEIYDMSSPADAYGIYSHDQDGDAVAVGAEGLYGAGLLRFWKGPYFVRLMAETETAETKHVILDLGSQIAAAISDASPKPRILLCLPGEGQDKKTVRYFHKQVSLNTLYYLADENILELNERSEVALAKYGAARGKAMLLICRYGSPAVARRAFLHFGRDFFSGTIGPAQDTVIAETERGEFAAVRLAANFLIVVMESPDRGTCVSLLGGAASKIQEVYPWPITSTAPKK